MRVIIRDGSGETELRYVVEDVDRHGNVRVYARLPAVSIDGKLIRRKVRLNATPGTEAFMVEYRAALAGTTALHEPSGDMAVTRTAMLTSPSTRPVLPKSLRWLVLRYYKSSEFMRHKRKDKRRQLLDRICEKHGDNPFASAKKGHIRAIRDERADAAGAANDRLKALRAVYKLAVDDDLMETNPAMMVPYIRVPSDGFHTWTEAEVLQYRKHHPLGTKARLACDLLLLLGPRISDVVRLGRQNERDAGRRIVFQVQKGRDQKFKELELPILADLRRSIDATRSGHLAYLVTEFGKPFSEKGFGNWFKKRCREAGLPHCSAHGLRKAGATFAAENGATEHELMAIYGWDSPKQAAIYTRKVRQKKMAARALPLVDVRVMEERKSDTMVPLSEAMEAGGTTRPKIS
jgi:integrase